MNINADFSVIASGKTLEVNLILLSNINLILNLKGKRIKEINDI